jgi:hypothetical protein
MDFYKRGNKNLIIKELNIPDPLMLEWDKLIQKKKEIRNDIYLSVRN